MLPVFSLLLLVPVPKREKSDPVEVVGAGSKLKKEVELLLPPPPPTYERDNTKIDEECMTTFCTAK